MERSENLYIRVEADNPTQEMLAKIIEVFPESMRQINHRHEKGIDIPKIIINYNICIEYYKVVKRLELIEEMLDSGIVYLANTKELFYQKCLAQNLFNKLEKIEKKFGAIS